MSVMICREINICWDIGVFYILLDMALGSTQPLTEMSTRNLPEGKERTVRKADNFTAICEPNVYRNMGASTSHNPRGLHGLLQGWLFLSITLLYALRQGQCALCTFSLPFLYICCGCLSSLGKFQDSTLIRPGSLSSRSFPIHHLSYHSTLYTLNTDGIVK
jgi:hypothetical protein